MTIAAVFWIALAILCSIASSVLIAVWLTLRTLRGTEVPKTVAVSGRMCEVCGRPALKYRQANGRWLCWQHKTETAA